MKGFGFRVEVFFSEFPGKEVIPSCLGRKPYTWIRIILVLFFWTPKHNTLYQKQAAGFFQDGLDPRLLLKNLLQVSLIRNPD